MCILPRAATPVPSAPTVPTSPAHLLLPQQRQELAVAALAGNLPITQLATDYQVSRKFVYQQADHAAQALHEAFTPDLADDDRILFELPVTALWLRRLILALLLLGHSSYRGVYELLRDLFHYPLSLGTIHNVAHDAMNQARTLNQQRDLSHVGIAAHDERFQTQRPVRVGVDVASTYCYLLSLEEQRDGDAWAVRLWELQTQGFAPQTIISDGGSGLLAGQALALPDTPRRGDVFHVFQKTTSLVTFLEQRAYQALDTCVQLEQQQVQNDRRQGRRDLQVSQKLRHARPAAAAAVTLADDVATLLDWLQHDVLSLTGPRSAERCALYDFVVAELRARARQGPGRLRSLCTYLVNQREAVLAFAQQLDTDLDTVAADFQVSAALVRAVLHVQALDVGDRRRWPREAALRQQLRGRCYEVQQAVAAVAQGTVRASSVVENLKSRLRNYFFL